MILRFLLFVSVCLVYGSELFKTVINYILLFLECERVSLLNTSTEIEFMTGKHRLSTSENLLVSIQEKIKWADDRDEIEKKHRKCVEDNLREVKNTLVKVS